MKVKKQRKCKKVKKILKAILIFLAVIIALITFYEIAIMYNGKVDKSDDMSKNDIVALLQKGSLYTNYHAISYKNGLFINKQKDELYKKNNITIRYINSKLYSWNNYNTNEGITICGNTAYFSNDIINTNQYAQEYFDYSDVIYTNSTKKSNEYNNCTTYYKFLGKIKYNGKDSVLIEIIDKNLRKPDKKYIIDLNTGIIEKKIIYYKIGILRYRVDINRKLITNCVSNNEVSKPNLSKYNCLNQ